MAMSITLLTKPVLVVGNKRVAYGTFDGNGSTTGSIVTGLKNIEVCFAANSEATGEHIRVVKNSNNATEGSVAGTIYFSLPTSDNTGYWRAVGIC